MRAGIRYFSARAALLLALAAACANFPTEDVEQTPYMGVWTGNCLMSSYSGTFGVFVKPTGSISGTGTITYEEETREITWQVVVTGLVAGGGTISAGIAQLSSSQSDEVTTGTFSGQLSATSMTGSGTLLFQVDSSPLEVSWTVVKSANY